MREHDSRVLGPVHMDIVRTHAQSRAFTHYCNGVSANVGSTGSASFDNADFRS